MPIYVFKDEDGKTVERLVQRGTQAITEDGRVYTRDLVAGFGVSGNATDPGTMKEQVRRGYRELENQGGRWKSNYSKKEIKRVWGI
tara:strand:+ start:105 stop:362 length:258 start_codon:yes stop_codon:yes gene_type:complete